MKSERKRILKSCYKIRDELGLPGRGVSNHIEPDYSALVSKLNSNLAVFKKLSRDPRDIFLEKNSSFADKVCPPKPAEFKRFVESKLEQELGDIRNNLRKLDNNISKLSSQNNKIQDYFPVLETYRDNLFNEKKTRQDSLDAGLDATTQTIISLRNLVYQSKALRDKTLVFKIQKEFEETIVRKRALHSQLQECSENYDSAVSYVDELKQGLEGRVMLNSKIIDKLNRFSVVFSSYVTDDKLNNLNSQLKSAAKAYSHQRGRRLAVVGALGALLIPAGVFSYKKLQKNKPMQRTAEFRAYKPRPGAKYQFEKVPGDIPVEMFHYISHDRNNHKLKNIPRKYVVSADELRTHFKDLYKQDFRPISLDEYCNDLSMIPPGKKPILITIDDASFGQFDFINPTQLLALRIQGKFSEINKVRYGGKNFILDPDCFVAIFREFNARHPDFRMKAAFAIDWSHILNPQYKVPFLQDGSEGAKLNLLLDWGFDLMHHGYLHKDFSKLKVSGMIQELGMGFERFENALGYRAEQVKHFAFPYGAIPRNQEALSAMRDFTYNGKKYHLELLFAATGGAAPNPYNGKHVSVIPRIEANSRHFSNRIYNRNDFYVTPSEPSTMGTASGSSGSTLR